MMQAKNMWTALAQQRQSHTRLIVSTVEARAAKRLKAKDEEIERIRIMNWALEERLRNLFMEDQMWRDVAQSHEATANVLRGDLQRALDVQAVHGGGSGHGQEDDAESCCWGENQVPLCAEEEVGTPVVEERPATGVGRCKGCREDAAVVLLLPCRHLCVCAPCAAAAQACPACGSAKNGSVCINFS
uniref:RING-type domain-containing protein n=1 Tax=Aegilops tauschii subsp. strangulata TaxID=200361 RepID=A0A453STA3_AEGTS